MTDRPVTEERPARSLLRRGRGLGLATIAAVTGILAVAALHKPESQGSRFAVVEQPAANITSAADPLMPELIRCRALPPEGVDGACAAAWEENRRRFFGEHRAMRVPGEPMPAYVRIPAAHPFMPER